tara:strand:- start:472 stop:795 length:324 start_codon:yes stop_codon:yes gene_type:complete
MIQLWKPKNSNNDIYAGRRTRIYYKGDGGIAAEGALRFISESSNIKGSYSVSVLDDNGFTNRVCTSEIIGRVYVQMFEISDTVKKISGISEDCCNIVNEYLCDYIEI